MVFGHLEMLLFFINGMLCCACAYPLGSSFTMIRVDKQRLMCENPLFKHGASSCTVRTNYLARCATWYIKLPCLFMDRRVHTLPAATYWLTSRQAHLPLKFWPCSHLLYFNGAVQKTRQGVLFINLKTDLFCKINFRREQNNLEFNNWILWKENERCWKWKIYLIREYTQIRSWLIFPIVLVEIRGAILFLKLFNSHSAI